MGAWTRGCTGVEEAQVRRTLRHRIVGPAAALGATAAAAGQGWTHFGGTPWRQSLTAGALPSIEAPTWLATTDENGAAAAFIGQAGVACDEDRVYALGRVGGSPVVLAFRRADGACEWSAPAEMPQVSSWATPAVDVEHGTVLVGAGSTLRAYDGASGAVKWSAALARPIVNASPLVTKDRGAVDRAFITDYDGFGDGARLYCVNVDGFDAGANPYQPGEVVWSAGIGSASGSTPAYDGERVFVATAGSGGIGAGWIMAFDAGAEEEPPRLWTLENVKAAGFHGGVCVAGGAVYAASYAFAGGRQSANVVKVDARTGGLVWSAGCNRTDATPAVVGDRVVVSGGIGGFGSVPTVQAFRDLGSSAEMLWDSASATWEDTDHDGKIDAGEYTPMGGWTHQPVVSVSGGGQVLLVGAVPVGGEQYSACTDLYEIDLDAEAGGPGWIIGHFAGAGSTPAVDGDVYTIGAGGLYAFRGCAADCDGSGILDLFDFLCFQNAFVGGEAYGDCDRDGARDLFDFLCFQNAFVGGCG